MRLCNTTEERAKDAVGPKNEWNQGGTAGILCLSEDSPPMAGKHSATSSPTAATYARGTHSKLRFPKSQVGQGPIPGPMGTFMWTTVTALRTPIGMEGSRSQKNGRQTTQEVSTSRLAKEFFSLP